MYEPWEAGEYRISSKLKPIGRLCLNFSIPYSIFSEPPMIGETSPHSLPWVQYRCHCSMVSNYQNQRLKQKESKSAVSAQIALIKYGCNPVFPFIGCPYFSAGG